MQNHFDTTAAFKFKEQQADAFAEDCATLLAEFASFDSGRFEDFCVAWKRFHFTYIFWLVRQRNECRLVLYFSSMCEF